MEDIQRLRTTAGSHKRIFIVETMGRRAGHLALVGGLAGSANVILIPEYDFEVEKVNEILLRRQQEGKRYSMVIVAEGAKPKNAHKVLLDKRIDEFGHVRLGGIGNYLAKEIEKGTNIETRCVILRHLQRGGAPSAKDRRMGFYFGTAAIEALSKKESGKMVSIRGGKIVLVYLEDAVKRLQLVDIDNMYDIEGYNIKGSILNKTIYD